MHANRSTWRAAVAMAGLYSALVPTGCGDKADSNSTSTGGSGNAGRAGATGSGANAGTGVAGGKSNTAAAGVAGSGASAGTEVAGGMANIAAAGVAGFAGSANTTFGGSSGGTNVQSSDAGRAGAPPATAGSGSGLGGSGLAGAAGGVAGTGSGPLPQGGGGSGGLAGGDGIGGAPVIAPSNWYPTGYTIFSAASLVVPGHLGSAVLGALSDINSASASNTQYIKRQIGALEVDRGYAPMTLIWDFSGSAAEAFTGIAMSLNAQSETLESADGKVVQKYTLPEHTLNLIDLNAPLTGMPVERAAQLCLRLRYAAGAPLKIKLEVKNASSLATITPALTRLVDVSPAAGWQSLCLDLSSFGQANLSTDFDPTKAKEVALVVIKNSVVPAISNPSAGTVDLDEIWFDGPSIVTRDALLKKTDKDFLSFLMFKAATRMVRLASPVAAIEGLALDRDAFGNLVSTGSMGFLLALLPEVVQKGWLSRADAAALAARGLAKLAACPDSAQGSGNIAVGYCKHRGIFYHFFGMLSPARKRNFDYPDSPAADESRNTVEVSTIDTALLFTGAAVVEGYFDGTSTDEQSIRANAKAIRDAADWRWAYSFDRGQLTLGWQPVETGIIPTEATAPPSCWRYGDSCLDPAVGYFASQDSAKMCSPQIPALLDFYTDESLLPNIFAMAAPLDHRPPARLWMNWDACDGTSCLSSSGSMFVYQFARLLGVDTSMMKTWAGKNLGESSCAVHAAAINATEGNLELPAAHETPFQTYRANSIRESLANDTRLVPSHDHAIAPYAWAGSFVCPNASIHADVIKTLRKLVELTPVYHPLTGLADVYYPDVAKAVLVDEASGSPFPDGTRRQGMWVNYTSFGIDQGPIALGMNLALCQIENNCSTRLATHATVTEALTNAECRSTGWIEAEWGAFGTCRRAAISRDSRCNAKPCETGAIDNFPNRDKLSGGQAAQIFQKGTALTFDALRFIGPVTLTVEYSLGGWSAADAAQVVLRACLDGTSSSNCATLPSLESTADWNTAKQVTVTLPASSAVSCSGTHSLDLVLEEIPQPWGVQIDRILVEKQ